jgi:hypothetical protein
MNKMSFPFQGSHGCLSINRNRGRIKIGCILSYLDNSGMGSSKATEPSTSGFHGNEIKHRVEDKQSVKGNIMKYPILLNRELKTFLSNTLQTLHMKFIDENPSWLHPYQIYDHNRKLSILP